MRTLLPAICLGALTLPGAAQAQGQAVHGGDSRFASHEPLHMRTSSRLLSATRPTGAGLWTRASDNEERMTRSTYQAGRPRDPLLNGMLIGLGIGASIGCAWAASDYDPDSFGPDFGRGGACAVGAVFIGGIGLGVGAGIDALVRRDVSHGLLEHASMVPSVLGRRGAALRGTLVW